MEEGRKAEIRDGQNLNRKQKAWLKTIILIRKEKHFQFF